MSNLVRGSNALGETSLDWVFRVIDFARSIGISVTCLIAPPNSPDSFLKGILIKRGQLIVCIQEAFPGDILHELGHISILPAQFRHLASGNLDEVERAMSRYMDVESFK